GKTTVIRGLANGARNEESVSSSSATRPTRRRQPALLTARGQVLRVLIHPSTELRRRVVEHLLAPPLALLGGCRGRARRVSLRPRPRRSAVAVRRRIRLSAFPHLFLPANLLVEITRLLLRRHGRVALQLLVESLAPLLGHRAALGLALLLGQFLHCGAQLPPLCAPLFRRQFRVR